MAACVVWLALAGLASASPEIDLKCDACKLGMAAAELLPLKSIQPLLVDVAVPICRLLNGTGKCDPTTVEGAWACKDLCKGMMNNEVSVLTDILKGRNYTHMHKCQLFHLCKGSPVVTDATPARVLSNLSDLSGEKPWSNWPEHGGELTGTFVHFTDLHLQRDYMIGSEIQCGQPTCCRREAGPGRNGSQAGAYGEAGCDASPLLFKAMVTAMASLPEMPDFILNTGDEPAHDVWAQTETLNLEAAQLVASDLKDGGLDSRPMAVAFGNHGSDPVNQYKGPGGDSWLYSGVGDAYSHWISDDGIRTLTFGGFYQERLAPGLRALCFHTTMFSEGGNWYFEANGTDFTGQFAWAEDALRQARARGEKVYVLHHHPQNSLDGFSGKFNRLMEEYQDIVVASFAGHAHTAFERVKFDSETSQKPIFVQYVSGSGDPNGQLNPTFRVYTYNTSTFEILDYTQHYLDIRAANANYTAGLPPVWKTDPPARELFRLENLSPAMWADLATFWVNNATDQDPTYVGYAEQYSRHFPPTTDRISRVKAGCDMLTTAKHILAPACSEADSEPAVAGPTPFLTQDSHSIPKDILSRLIQVFVDALGDISND